MLNPICKIVRKDGATFTDSQDSLRKLWEDHYATWFAPEYGIPEEHQADSFAVQFEDGKISVVGWVNFTALPCEPIELRPEEYTITLS